MARIGEKGFEMQWLSKLIGPTKSFLGSAVSYTSGIWEVVDRAGTSRLAKGIMTTSGADGGILNVHLANDYDSSNNKVYCPIPLGTNDVKAVIFDEVAESGTTISLAEVIIAMD
jgi:hypothetical protein